MDMSFAISRHNGSARILQRYTLPLMLVVLQMARISLAFCPRARRADVVVRCRREHRPFRRRNDLTGLRDTYMMVSSSALSRIKSEKTDEFFRNKDRMVEFGSSQRVEVSCTRKQPLQTIVKHERNGQRSFIGSARVYYRTLTVDRLTLQYTPLKRICATPDMDSLSHN